MDSIAVVIRERDNIRSRSKEIVMTVALPASPLNASVVVDPSMMRYANVPKGFHLRELARVISRHLEGEILAALTKAGAV